MGLHNFLLGNRFKLVIFELSNQRRIWLNLIRCEFIATKLRMRLQLLKGIVIMVHIIISKELLYPCTIILIFPMALKCVKTKSAVD
jgi:hypothetical protein